MIIWNALLIALNMTLIGYFVHFSVKDKEAGKKYWWVHLLFLILAVIDIFHIVSGF